MRFLWNNEIGDWDEPQTVLAKRASQARSVLSSPLILNGNLDDVWNPVNGQRYTCKRSYERAVNASGSRIVGNDLDLSRSQRPEINLNAKQDIAKAFDETRSS